MGRLDKPLHVMHATNENYRPFYCFPLAFSYCTSVIHSTAMRHSWGAQQHERRCPCELTAQ